MNAKGQTDFQIMDDLLATKMEFPFLGSRIIPRSRLTRLLQESMKRRVCLIVAPTGYGKTTLLGEWLSSSIPPDWRIAWISIDSYDNDPLRFWSYVGASLKKVYPKASCNPQQLHQIRDDPFNYQLLTPIINLISQLPFEICMILDDYQNIKDDRIHAGMSFLIDHQPNKMHLVISSRIAPPIPLSRLRAQMQLVEITTSDLSFNFHEVEMYLTNIMHLKVDAEQVAALQNATEGWIAGLQLAALSLQNCSDTQRLIANLPGGNRQIFEYLIEETLIHQNNEIKEFLLKTSILSEINASLCDALLERDDSKEILAQIQKANLFLVSLDEQSRWFRYHHLFAEVLRKQLHDTFPELLNPLHHKACSWFLENGYPDKAVSHALETGDLELAAKIIDTSALQAVIGFDLDKLMQWIGRFSEELLSERPRLGIYQALASYLLWRIDKVEPILQALEQMLAVSRARGLNNEEDEQVQWEIQAIRACMNCSYGDAHLGIPKALALRKNHPKKDVYFQGLMSHALAEAYASQGELEKAAAQYLWGINFAETHSLSMEYFYSYSELAHVRKIQGQYAEAERMYRHLLEYTNHNHLNLVLSVFAQTGIVEIALARYDLETADKWMAEVINSLPAVEGCPLTWVRNEWTMTRIANYYLSKDDAGQAELFFSRAINGYRENPYVIRYLYSDLINTRARLWAQSNKSEPDDESYLNDLALLNPEGKAWMAERIAFARYQIATSRPESAIETLVKIEKAAREHGMLERHIETLILMSLSYDALSQTHKADELILKAVRLSEPEGIAGIFLDEGETAKIILERVASIISSQKDAEKSSAELDWLEQLIAKFSEPAEIEKTGDSDIPAETATLSPLMEPISPREMEVLKMMVDGMTTKEIAAALMISRNTAKTHLRSIYRKMGSHNRFALARRAEELFQMKSSDQKP